MTELVTLPKELIERLTKWRLCMSHNDSYFGEPAGELKRIVREIEHAIAAPPAPSSDTAGAIGWRQRFPVNYSRSGYGEWSTIYCDDRAHLEEATEEAKDHGFQVELIYGSSSATPPAPSVADERRLHLLCGVPEEPNQSAPSVADAAGASEDARDASRWRHLRNCGVIVDFTHAGPWKFTDDVDAAVDKLMARSAAINAASGSKTIERKKLCKGSHIMCEGREYCLGHPSCNDLAKESGK